MKALVIGGTGLVGNELTKQLFENEKFDEVVLFLRRSTGLIHQKLHEEIVDFDHPEQWEHLLKGDVLFSALGTTLKTAGSKAAQFKVDYTYQYQCAKAASENGVKTYVLISSVGADPKSKIFYSRIKGELDEAVLKLPFQSHFILRPSLLMGKRGEKRGGEGMAQTIMPVLTKYLFKKYRPIQAKTVAQAMIRAALIEASKTIYTLDEIFALANSGKSAGELEKFPGLSPNRHVDKR